MTTFDEQRQQLRSAAITAGVLIAVLVPTTLAVLAPVVGLRWWHGLIAGAWVVLGLQICGGRRNSRRLAEAEAKHQEQQTP